MPGVEPNTRVTVYVVVVLEEFGAERSGVFNGTEPLGELGAVLEGLEGCFRKRVVDAPIDVKSIYAASSLRTADDGGGRSL